MRSHNLSVTCLAARLFVTLLAAFVFGGFASATPVITANLVSDPGDSGLLWDAGPSGNGYTLQDINTAGGIQIGDKLFDQFTVNSTGNNTALLPSYSTIAVTPIQVISSGDYGMIFNGSWTAPAGQSSDSSIHFHALVLGSGYFFEDNALWMTEFGVANSTTNGGVSISENLYPNLFSQHSTSFANEMVYYVNDSNENLYDHATFTPITEMWVAKNVDVYGGTGTTGYAHLSEFYETFSQTPEPSTLVLLGIGGLGLLGYILRRRRG